MGKSITMNINPIIHLWFDWDSIDLSMTQPGLPSSWSLGLVVFRASQPCWTSSSSRHIFFFFSQQVARAKMVCFTAKTHIMPSVDTIAPTFCWVVHSSSSNSRTGKTILFHRWLDYLLLFQKTQVQYPALMSCRSQWPVTAVLGREDAAPSF